MISPIIKVAAAILEKDSKILIARRKKGEYLEGKWEFPGGKIESGESPEECLKRELKEELDIESEIGDFICSGRHVYPHITIELLVYQAKLLAGEAKALDHAEIRWVDHSELRSYDFLDADLPVIEEIRSIE